MTELDELERDLRAAGDIWFRDDLLAKLERLIAIAREGERTLKFVCDNDVQLARAYAGLPSTGGR